MISLKEVMEFLGASEEDVIKAIYSTLAPTLPPEMRRNILKYHFSLKRPAITTEEIQDRLEACGFKCQRCGSQFKVAFDWINGDKGDCSLENTIFLCFSCKSKADGLGDMRYVLFLAAIRLWKRSGVFPKNCEISAEAGVGESYLKQEYLNFLRKRAASNS